MKVPGVAGESCGAWHGYGIGCVWYSAALRMESTLLNVANETLNAGCLPTCPDLGIVTPHLHP